MPDHYSIAEAADRFGVTHSTVWRWIDSGKLRAEKIASTPFSQQWRIPASELDRLEAA